jgi:quinol monooxygenase YgiN
MYTVTGRWSIKQGCEAKARTALKQLARNVQEKEPDTLLYLVHVPSMKGFSFPAASPLDVIFVEGYKDLAAFNAHLNGPVFTQFLDKHLDLFLTSPVTLPDGRKKNSLLFTAESLLRLGGFVRLSEAV